MHPQKHQKLKVTRKDHKILGDTSRVITRLHLPNERHRIPKIIQRVMSLPGTEAENLLSQIIFDDNGDVTYYATYMAYNGVTSLPQLIETEEEREGYVPNVVYACGAIFHNSDLVIPYGMADMKTGIATVAVSELIDCMFAVAESF
jgi:hypothetical protein